MPPGPPGIPLIAPTIIEVPIVFAGVAGAPPAPDIAVKSCSSILSYHLLLGDITEIYLFFMAKKTYSSWPKKPIIIKQIYLKPKNKTIDEITS